jgi:hypothetical protein
VRGAHPLGKATQTGAIVRFLVWPGPPGLGEEVQNPTLKKLWAAPLHGTLSQINWSSQARL